MDSELAQELIDAIRSLTKAVEENTLAVASTGKTAFKKAGKKPGNSVWDGVQVLALAKQWPSEHGWFKTKIGTITRGEWFDTKSKAISEILAFARDAGCAVNITFDETQNGAFTNRRLQTIEVVEKGGNSKAAVASPEVEKEEELEESPF